MVHFGRSICVCVCLCILKTAIGRGLLIYLRSVECPSLWGQLT